MKNVLKSFCCATLLILASVACAEAQSMQLRGGPSMSTIVGSNTFDQGVIKMRAGFFLGISKDIPLASRIFFQPGITYSLQGFKTSIGVDRYHYLLIPLTFKFDIGTIGGFMIGPQIGLVPRGVTRAIGSDVKGPMTPSLNILNASIGAGPYVRINDRMNVEVRVIQDITKINRNHLESSVYNFVVQGGISWTINSNNNQDSE